MNNLDVAITKKEKDMIGNHQNEPQCVACNRTEKEIPLITLEYQNKKFWICPQHLPMLIHDPKTLIGKLPGAEGMEPAEHKH